MAQNQEKISTFEDASFTLVKKSGIHLFEAKRDSLIAQLQDKSHLKKVLLEILDNEKVKIALTSRFEDVSMNFIKKRGIDTLMMKKDFDRYNESTNPSKEIDEYLLCIKDIDNIIGDETSLMLLIGTIEQYLEYKYTSFSINSEGRHLNFHFSNEFVDILMKYDEDIGEIFHGENSPYFYYYERQSDFYIYGVIDETKAKKCLAALEKLEYLFPHDSKKEYFLFKNLLEIVILEDAIIKINY